MNLVVTCKCGNKFRVSLAHEEDEFVCPGCGKISSLNGPKEIEEEFVTPEEDEEIRLLDLPVTSAPIDDFEEDSGGTFAIVDDIDKELVHPGPGMYGAIAVIRLRGPSRCIAFGSRGDYVLAGLGEDVAVIDMKSVKTVGSYEGHQADVTAAALSLTTPLAVTGDETGEMQLWEVDKGTQIRKLGAHKASIQSVALAPNGAFAATGSEACRIRLWDLQTGEQRDLENADWAEYEQDVTYVTFSRDGTRVLAGGSGGRVSMWDVETGRRLARYSGLKLPVSCVRLSDEGGQVLATTEPVEYRGANHLTICHWDAATATLINEFNITIPSMQCCVAPDRGGKRLIIAGGDRDPWMGIWSLQNGRLLYNFEHFRGTPLSLAVSPLNNRVVAALGNARLQVFGIETS